KLDRRIDHVLVDEAQDTNAAQWRIIRAMVGEFFSGEGARTSAWGGPGGKPPPRTLFVVGDYKQAIFGFQGTSPENFARAGAWVKGEMAAATANARQQRGGEEAEGLLELGLERSFRTARPVLDFVDLAMARMGAAQFGLDRPAEPHQGQPRPGYVALWAPVGGRPDEEEEDEPAGEDEGPAVAQNWLSRTDRQMAERLAAQVKAWLADGFALVKGEKEGEARAATPGDIMVLVRKRRDLAGLIVARLHAAGVPVAGVDRLRLAAPLAVRDLVAALRFAAQPLDDLNLASLLVSPLVGWSQAQLLAHGHRPRGTRLWDHIRRSPHAEAGAVREQLAPLLARADFDTVPALLQWLLVGPWAGRARLLTRLGAEAADPIEELVNAALAHAASATS
ncbi:MAG TPA: UvrD-helicase domain-containing protein, partial [Novosphingobium sp.]|nr:UvrD-helicase domain-containing protein [Novosphingobium sp.]